MYNLLRLDDHLRCYSIADRLATSELKKSSYPEGQFYSGRERRGTIPTKKKKIDFSFSVLT